VTIATKRLINSPIFIIKKAMRNEIPKSFPSLASSTARKSNVPKEA
jgi:hypothetical protein